MKPRTRADLYLPPKSTAAAPTTPVQVVPLPKTGERRSEAWLVRQEGTCTIILPVRFLSDSGQACICYSPSTGDDK